MNANDRPKAPAAVDGFDPTTGGDFDPRLSALIDRAEVQIQSAQEKLEVHHPDRGVSRQ